MTRQQANYHLRVLEAAGLVELVETRQRRGCTERILRAVAGAFVVDPAVMQPPGAVPSADRFAAEHLVATAAAVVRDVSRMQAAAGERRLLTFTIEADIGLRAASRRRGVHDRARRRRRRRRPPLPRPGRPALPRRRRRPPQPRTRGGTMTDGLRIEVTLPAPVDDVWPAFRDPDLIRQWHGWEDESLDDEIRMIFADGTTVEEDGRALHVGGHRFTFEPAGAQTIVRVVARRRRSTPARWTGTPSTTRSTRAGCRSSSSCASPWPTSGARRGTPSTSTARRSRRRAPRTPSACRRRRPTGRATPPTSPARRSPARCGSAPPTSSG